MYNIQISMHIYTNIVKNHVAKLSKTSPYSLKVTELRSLLLLQKKI